MDLTCAAASPFYDAKLNDVGGLLGSSPIDLKLSTILIYLLGLQSSSVSGVITNVSVIQSWNWFFHLSAFESVLLFFVIAKIGVFEILGILPINLTEFWEGTATGRRKKRYALHPSTKPEPHVALATAEIGAKLLILYKKLDKNECGLRALCELQSKVTHDGGGGNYEKRQLPRATLSVLRSLRSYAEYEKGKRQQQESRNATGSSDGGKLESNGNGSSVDMHAALQPFLEAVKIGSQYGRSLSHGCNFLYRDSSACNQVRNVCERKFPNCPVTSDEVLGYMEQIDLLLQEF